MTAPTTHLAALGAQGLDHPMVLALLVLVVAFAVLLYGVFRVRPAFFRRGGAMALEDGRRASAPGVSSGERPTPNEHDPAVRMKPQTHQPGMGLSYSWMPS